MDKKNGDFDQGHILYIKLPSNLYVPTYSPTAYIYSSSIKP